MIRLHNTLTNTVEEFKPLSPDKVGMYHCGPTVYDYVHVGNLRSYLFADTLRRTFEYAGFEVKQVMNITDLGHLTGDGDQGEDKMTKALVRENRPITIEAMAELAGFYTERFKEDLNKLNILSPQVLPKASEHLTEQIELIKKLEEKGFTYTTTDGIYFDTSRDPHYGKLGIAGGDESRIGPNPEKKNQKDFALWKFNESLGFTSPWGQGFPGWHIECSAMSTKYLGETFDIHTGGIDLAPIHHNNEIAQSENASEKPLANYWLHNEFINLSQAKMAKSEGNVVRLQGIVDRDFSPLSYRYFILLSHYRSKANFTWEALQSAENAYRKIKEFVSSIPNIGDINLKYKTQFVEAIENDLNTPEALAILWNLIKDSSVSPEDKKATLLDFDKVLGLNIDTNEFAITEIPAEVEELMKKREQARGEKDFIRSDELREEIKKKGFDV
ncbi:MAG: cysteine--tRNA ligase, partial [Parcubacteria group bacterium]